MRDLRRRPVATPDDRAVRLARRRFARRQWARRWLAWRPLALLFGLLAVAAGAVWLLFFSSLLAVAGVQVEGTSVLREQDVRRVAAVPRGEPLARVDLGAIAGRVGSLAPIKSVDVSRAWPDRVRIAVQERVAVAVVEQAGSVRGLDAGGVLFRRYRSAEASGLPVVRTGTGTRAEALAEAATVVDVLPEPLADRVAYVQVRTVDTISLQLVDGRTVFWGSADESTQKAEVLAALLRQKATAYDVSVPAAPTIRP